MSLSSLKCFAPEAEACSDIAEVSSMISDIMMKCVCNSSTSYALGEEAGMGTEVHVWRYYMAANRNAESPPARSQPVPPSHVSGNVSVSFPKMYSDRLSEVAHVCLKENAPQVRKISFATRNISLLYNCIFASILISYN